jgi:phage FluMu protein Com
MPIRFRCKRCNQWLAIASRKAGSEIQCPKCGWSQVVPNQEAASAAMAMDQFAKNHETAENGSSLTVYDDQPAPIEIPQPAQQQKTAASTPASATADLSAAEGQLALGKPVPRGMILYPRSTLYVQGALLLILFAVGFGSGYLIGRGGAENKEQGGQSGKERILIEGNLVYDPGTGRLAGDQNAVIIALPEGKYPKTKISFQGIRPKATSTESHESVQMIRKLGGEYARADASGEFSMVLPDRGSYHLLIISNQATRPEGTEIDEADVIELERYFSMAGPLISRSKYSWTLREIEDHIEIEHDFGRDGQE